MRASIIVIAATLLFAGCLGQEEPIEESAAEEAPASASPSAASPTAPAPEETKDVPGVDQAEEEQTLTTIPYATEGQIGAGWCAPAGPNTCLTVGPSVGDDRSWLKLEQDGALVHASLTLTWEASSPTTEQLRFSLLRAKSCGDGCTEGESVGEPAVGSSPLVLDMDVAAPAEGEWLELVVRPARLTPDPVYMQANLDQPFHVEGTLTVLT